MHVLEHRTLVLVIHSKLSQTPNNQHIQTDYTSMCVCVCFIKHNMVHTKDYVILNIEYVQMLNYVCSYGEVQNKQVIRYD